MAVGLGYIRHIVMAASLVISINQSLLAHRHMFKFNYQTSTNLASIKQISGRIGIESSSANLAASGNHYLARHGDIVVAASLIISIYQVSGIRYQD